MDADLESNLSSFSSSEHMGIWVPQAPNPLHQYSQMGGELIGFNKDGTNMKANNRTWRDDSFTVPQISPLSVGSKRSRPF